LKTSTEFVIDKTDNKTGMPLQHYQALYQDLDPLEIAQRCNLEFNSETAMFSLRVLGTEYRVPHPVFAMLDSEGKEAASAHEKILFMHYLTEGKFFPAQGKQLSYHEIPWGPLYYQNFEGRCLKRSAFTFGKNIAGFKKIFEQNPQLRSSLLQTGDAGFRLEFINNLYLSMILWQGDDEFPPSAQILFDDNFVYAFTAEDIAAVGDVLIGRLKNLLPK
jgi:hypothetical protein